MHDTFGKNDIINKKNMYELIIILLFFCLQTRRTVGIMTETSPTETRSRRCHSSLSTPRPSDAQPRRRRRPPSRLWPSLCACDLDSKCFVGLESGFNTTTLDIYFHQDQMFQNIELSTISSENKYDLPSSCPLWYECMTLTLSTLIHL